MIRTYNDLEDWVKNNANKCVDGTYQHAVFNFVAMIQAMDYTLSRSELAHWLVNGIKPMDVHRVQWWMIRYRTERRNFHFSHGTLASMFCDSNSIDELLPDQIAILDAAVDEDFIVLLKDYFVILHQVDQKGV